MFSSMEGGELFQRIQERQDGAFTERGKCYSLKNFGTLLCMMDMELFLLYSIDDFDFLSFCCRSCTGHVGDMLCSQISA